MALIEITDFHAAKDDFLELKRKLRMENNNDIIRWAIAYSNKRFVFK